jgi:photosystem II stability/assembly factor-like uncharacterized protein
MKKFLSLLLLFPLIAAGQWDYINPVLTRAFLYDIVFMNSQTGLAVGENGTMIRSVDGGNTWDTIPCPVSSQLLTIGFKDEFTGFIGTDAHGYLKSIDGGIFWTWIPFPHMKNILDIQFIDGFTGYIVGNGDWTIMKTIDGGNTWQNCSPAGLQPSLRAIHFINNNTGYAVGGISAVYKTTDGGAHWSAIPWTGGGQWFFRDVLFFNENIGVMAWENGIFRTVNGGVDWTLAYHSPGSYNGVNEIIFKDQVTGYATGPAGTILKTIDGGITWNDQANPSPKSFAAICITPDDHVFVCGGGGTVMGSSDLGASWHYKTTITDATLYDLVSWSDGESILCGEKGLILRSDDYGSTWTKMFSATSRNLIAIDFPSLTTGFAAGGSGCILKTTDGGSNWFHVAIDSGYSWLDICFTDTLTGYVTGTHGKLKKTSDGGTTWVEQVLPPPGGEPNYTISFPTADTGYIGGYYGIIYKTTNAGDSWFAVGSVQPWSYVSAITFLSSTHGFATVSNGPVTFETIDGGLTWTQQSNEWGYWYSILFRDDLHGFVCGEYGNLAATENGGQTWKTSKVAEGMTELNAISFFNADTGLMTGSYGTVMRTTNGGVLVNITKNHNRNMLKIVPNPNPGVFRVCFPESSEVGLFEIYSSTGEKIAEKNIQKGQNEAIFNLTSSKPGLYLIRLITKSTLVSTTWAKIP